MALIQCPECGKQISDMAPSCPHCGRPARLDVDPVDKIPKRYKTATIYAVILILLGAFVLALNAARGYRTGGYAGNWIAFIIGVVFMASGFSWLAAIRLTVWWRYK